MPGGAQRLERREEPAEDLAAKLTRGPVDPAAIVLRRLVAQVGGSCSTFTGCRVITPNALTCITNPSGVRSAQRSTISSTGSR